MDADDVAVISDLEIKGRAFLRAIEAARSALERMRMAAAKDRSAGGLLSETMAYGPEPANPERRLAPIGGRRRTDLLRSNLGTDLDE